MIRIYQKSREKQHQIEEWARGRDAMVRGAQRRRSRQTTSDSEEGMQLWF